MTGRDPDEETTQHSQPPKPQPAWTANPSPQPPWTLPPTQAWPGYQQSWYPSNPYQGNFYVRRDEYGTSPLATASGVLLVILGSFTGLIGAGMLYVAALTAFPDDADVFVSDALLSVAALIAFFGLVVGILGALEIASGVGVLSHKSWGRWLGFAVTLISVIAGFFFVVGTLTYFSSVGGIVVTLLWVAANAFVAASMAVAKEHFQRSS